MVFFPHSRPESAAVGWYQPKGQVPQRLVVSRLELSGWAEDAKTGQWQPLDRVQLDPAQTALSGHCSCPIHWKLQPLS